MDFVKYKIDPPHNTPNKRSNCSGNRNIIEGFGWPKPSTSNNWPGIDFIEFFDRRSPRIIEIVGPLYLKGLSISDIHDQTGIPRSSIYSSLRTNRHSLRPQKSVPFDRWRKGHGKTRNKPPYGWCFSQGELVKDPREYPVVQLIESLWKQGRTVGEIVRYLNGNGYRSRLNRDWGYGVIKGIIKRLKSS